jgi:Clp amino terminal domain, pathogenicity island component
MFERFDDDARSAVVRARSEAIRTGQAEVGTAQLLVGVASGVGLAAEALAAAGAGVAQLRKLIPRGGAPDGPGGLEPLDAEALASIGIDLDTVSRATDAAFGPGSLTRTRARRRVRRRKGSSPRMAEAAKAALTLARHSALRLGQHHISAGHVLLGLLDQPASQAASILKAAGADVAVLRAQVTQELIRAEANGRPGAPGQ